MISLPASLSIWVISLDFSMSRAVHPHESWMVDVEIKHVSLGFSFHVRFCSKLIAIYTAKGKYDPFSWFTNQVVSVIRSFWLAVQTMCRKLLLRGWQHWVQQRQVSLYTGILLLRQQQDLCGLWVVCIHLCGVCWCFHPVVLSLTYTSVTLVSVPALLHPVVLSHTLLLHLLVFPPCYTV